ncbi:MAG: TlpA disulfide reductase family protein [Chloroflexota bacterium]|nr:TlpA disulfide reductase family protein [Chloroflexota bacterium]
MSKLNQVLRLLAAFLSMGAAIAVLTHAGLPDRADYSGFWDGGRRAVAPEAGWRAPPFTLLTTSSRPLALEQARGRAAIINFWATWCEPCQREMRELQALYEIYANDLRILAVNVGESVDDVRDWAARLGLKFDILLDARGDVSTLYQVRGLPTTFVLDEDHVVRSVHYGPVRLESLQRDLARFGRKA